MATTSNAATRPLRPAKLTNLFLRGALDQSFEEQNIHRIAGGYAT
ncbi:MAG: hypothetical protein V7606_380, partial [Burkholderiales bacterium]